MILMINFQIINHLILDFIHKVNYFSFFALFLLLISAIFSQDFEEIDSNLLSRNFEDTIIPLNKLNTEYPKNLEVLVRLSAAHHLLSEKVYDKAMDTYHLDKSLHYITEAIKIDSTNGEIHKWYALAYGKKLENANIRTQIEGSKIIAFHSTEAIKKLPDDPYCYNVMGQWHYRLADLGKVSRKLAQIIFEEPPEGSFEVAESYFKTSIALEPEYIGTYYWLGKTYQKLGKADDALSVFKKGIKLLPPYKREEAMYKEMIKILEKNDRKKS